ECQATGCLFVAAAQRSLLHVEGAAEPAEKLKDRLRWKGDHNAYANLKDRMLDQRPPGDAAPPPAVGGGEWAAFAAEEDAAFPPGAGPLTSSWRPSRSSGRRLWGRPTSWRPRPSREPSCPPSSRRPSSSPLAGPKQPCPPWPAACRRWRRSPRRSSWSRPVR